MCLRKYCRGTTALGRAVGSRTTDYDGGEKRRGEFAVLLGKDRSKAASDLVKGHDSRCFVLLKKGAGRGRRVEGKRPVSIPW